MFFHSAGLSKGAFCGLIAVLFVLYVGFAFLYSYQVNYIYDSGLDNSKNYDWIQHSYYSWGVLGSLGGIIAGQTRRVYHIEHNASLPPLRESDITSATISLFLGSVLMSWGLAYNAPYDGSSLKVLDKWSYLPYIFIFTLIALGTEEHLKVKQDIRQWVAISLITFSLMLIFLAIPASTEFETYFSGWALIFFIASVCCYSHFWVKLEFMLKRRACTVFEVAEKFGVLLLISYSICIFVTSIFQWCAGYDWILGIYIKAVFTNSAANFFLTILVPFVVGAIQIICLSLIYNSSALRFMTIIFMPSGLVMAFIYNSNWLLITAHILFFTGLVLYNATTVCGSEAIQEQKIEMAYDAYENEHFKKVQDDGQVNV